MQEILNQHIKPLIERYPAIATVLEQFKIGCTSCAVGTCQLKDVVEIHALSEADERALFTGIAEIVFPGQSVDIPRLPRKAPVDASRKLSPPIRMLVEEHRHIKQVIAAIAQVVEGLGNTLPQKKDTILKMIDFIRNYADRFHHAKEEDILFRLFDESTEIIAAMHTEHEIGRNHVRQAAKALDVGDATLVASHLVQYGELLTEHIRKEDEILYPWIDRTLSDTQVGTLYAQFLDVEKQFGDSPQQYVAFAKGV